MLNLYEIIGKGKDARKSSIRSGFNDRKIALHPRNNLEANATEKYILLFKAYAILSNKKYRNKYNVMLESSKFENISDNKLFRMIASERAIQRAEDKAIYYLNNFRMIIASVVFWVFVEAVTFLFFGFLFKDIEHSGLPAFGLLTFLFGFGFFLCPLFNEKCTMRESFIGLFFMTIGLSMLLWAIRSRLNKDLEYNE